MKLSALHYKYVKQPYQEENPTSYEAKPSQFVVVDETHIGFLSGDGCESMRHGGISKGAPRIRKCSRSQSAVRARILKRLPGKTLWKGSRSMKKCMKSAIKKRPAGFQRKQPAGRDARSDGRWLWGAVSVGHGSTRYTHGNGRKRFAWRILPHSTMAEGGKPRGTAEIKKTFEKHIHKGSTLIFDGWKASKTAAEELKLRYAAPVVHEVGWRDAATGWHSNDIESEFNRLKHWNRVRLGNLRITELDLHEYTFYINAGSEVDEVMTGLSVGAGVAGRKFVF